MSSSDRNLLRQGLRHNLLVFIHQVLLTVAPGTAYQRNWHIDAIAHHLRQCGEGLIKRLAITVPPRHLKSTCASVALVAWLLGHDPTCKVIVVSYSRDLADKFARDFRLVVNSDWYRELFPKMRPERDTEAEFLTTQGGYRLATSVGGTLTGRGADLIIIDDPIKPADAMSKILRDNVIEWYRTTLFSRLNDKRDGRIIIVMQRLHQDDLVGHVLEHEPDMWTRLDLPAIAQENETIPIGDGQVHERKIGEVLDSLREPERVLESIKAALGSATFSAQYLQRPVPAEGNMILRKWLQYYGRLPARDPDTQVIQSWDTAMKPDQRNDPSVCTTWLEQKGHFYLLDVTRERVNYPDLKRLVVRLAADFRSDVVIIEDKGSGTSLIQDLSNEGLLHPIAFKPKLDKTTRMDAQTAKIEAGQVLLPREAPWLATFLEEILAFPNSRHDDQVDSMSQFLAWISERPKPIFEYDFGWDEPVQQTVAYPYV